MYGSTEIQSLRTRTWPGPGSVTDASTRAKSVDCGSPAGRATRCTSCPAVGVDIGNLHEFLGMTDSATVRRRSPGSQGAARTRAAGNPGAATQVPAPAEAPQTRAPDGVRCARWRMAVADQRRC